MRTSASKRSAPSRARVVAERTAIGWAAAAILLIAVAASPTSGVAGGPPPTSCEYSPADHALTVSSSRRIRIERTGATITIFSVSEPVSCIGGTSTVHNTDSIAVTNVEDVELDLDHRLAPGFTDEAGGSSEIEIHLALRRGGWVSLDGTGGSDSLTLGTTTDGRGVNLTPGEAQADADLTLNRRAGFWFSGRAGADSTAAQGRGDAFTGPFPLNMELHGNGGRDRLGGGTGKDYIDGHADRDRIAAGAGAGNDRVYGSQDGQMSDAINCGAGFDRGAFDRIDRLRNCERPEY